MQENHGGIIKMNENVQKIIDLRVEKTIRALEKNNMKGYYVKSRDELYELVDELIANDKLITAGGSATLEEVGINALLNEKYSAAFASRAKCGSPAEIDECMRKAFVSDTFFASSNAVTEEGELYNVDGTGNRDSAMIFGPKQVIIIAGVNKIVHNMEEAERRVEKIAAPANTVRLCQETPCSKTGECAHCHSPQRICCSYVRLGQQRVKDRIKVIFINESLGF